MIFVALGSNLAGKFKSPRHVCEAAVTALESRGVTILQLSSWYESEPVPKSDQPWFVNGVVEIATDLTPTDLLATLLDVEEEFGRIRQNRNEARIIDLDLLAYGDEILKDEQIILPHPRLHERLFVLQPLAQICPDWQHPVLKRSAEQLLQSIPTEFMIKKLDKQPVSV